MRNNLRLYIFTLLIVSIMIIVFPAGTSAANETVTIGVVIDGPWARSEEIQALFQSELNDLLSREYDVRFPTDKVITADWTESGINSALENLIHDDDVDIVIAGGILASAYACRFPEFTKPVVAPFVLDADLQGLPFSNGASGVKNLNYIMSPERFETDIQAYRDIYEFNNPVMLISRTTSELYPSFTSDVEDKARALGIELKTLIVEASVQPALEDLPPDTDAVILTALYPLKPSETEYLTYELIRRKLPGFSGLFREDIENGIFAGRIPDNHFLRRARRVALNIQRILRGEDAGDIQVAMSYNFRTIINMKTARAINVYPSFHSISEADLLYPTRKTDVRRLSLANAVDEAIKANLDLAVKSRSVSAGEQDITAARSNLLPHFEISALETIIDKDSAAASMGMQAERVLSGSASVTQLLFSESAWANFTIQKYIQNSREEELKALKLDIANDSAEAYLNLLKAKTIENIRRENLKLISKHLEIARVRKSVGISGPADVYRLDSKIATTRLDVINSQSARNAQEMILNRLLHRPVEESFSTEETRLEGTQFLIGDSRVLKYLRDQWSFRVLREFMVKSGLEYAPELRGIDAAISARKRALASTKRAYYTPSLGLQGILSNKFSKNGAGSEGGGFSIPEPKDDSWSLGLNLSLPVFKGGSKRAAHIKAKEELNGLELQRESVAELIEQRIRTALHFAGRSFAGISLTKDAADAAHNGLQLVEDSYAQGVVSIIDLLDAQNAALSADLASANAEYNFLIDILEVQRATGCVHFLMTDEEKNVFFTSLENYFRDYIARENE